MESIEIEPALVQNYWVDSLMRLISLVIYISFV